MGDRSPAARVKGGLGFGASVTGRFTPGTRQRGSVRVAADQNRLDCVSLSSRGYALVALLHLALLRKLFTCILAV